MGDDDLRAEDEPRPDDVAWLEDRLYDFNAGLTGVRDGRWLAVFVRDASGAIVAGLHGWTWGGTGFVRTLWVREDLRGHGLGTRLLAAAEREATKRGCHQMHLDTSSHQAPGFYRRLGYEAIGELPGWPRDATRVFFHKPLAPPARPVDPVTGERVG